MKLLFTSILVVVAHVGTWAQGCCSGGSGSPIAGGVSQGVLTKDQMELGLNFQHLSSNKFKSGRKDTAALFHQLSSNYLYGRVAYGVSEKLTFSVETGYFLNKTQIERNESDTISSNGIGDLIIFPRYQVFSKSNFRRKMEAVFGMGYKMPLGHYNDSHLVYTNPLNGKQFFAYSPPTIQTTTGANDFIFYGFFLNEFKKQKLKTFVSAVYIKTGWNPLGQNFGDYKSISVFASRTFYEKLGLMMQLKAEHIGKLDYDKQVDMLALYNIDVTSTGSKKLFFIPQMSYSMNRVTAFAYSEIPIYQNLNGVQVASKFNLSAGLSYRFMVKKPKEEI